MLWMQWATSDGQCRMQWVFLNSKISVSVNREGDVLMRGEVLYSLSW